MAENNRRRFVVQGDKGPRTLFSIGERPNGDLIIPLGAATRLRDQGKFIGQPSDNASHGKRILESRYSVHTSPLSQNGVNVIKHTLRLEDGSPLSHVVNTTAFKRTGKLEMIYGRRCTDMVDPYYDVPANKPVKTICVDQVETGFTLTFAIAIGPRDFAFATSSDADYNVRREQFTNFSIFIYWSWLSILAHESGNTTHLLQNPGGLSPGLSPQECAHLFKTIRNRWRDEFVGLMTNDPQFQKYHEFIRASKYFRSASHNSKEFKKHAARLIARRIL